MHNPFSSGSNHSGEPALPGQSETVNRAYKAVSALRQSTRTNPSMGPEGGWQLQRKKLAPLKTKMMAGRRCAVSGL